MTTETELEEEEIAQYEFDEEFQRSIVNLMLRDSSFASQATELIKPEYFTNESLGSLAAMAREHYRTYRAIPERSVIATVAGDWLKAKKVNTSVAPDFVSELQTILKSGVGSSAFVASKVEEFAKHQAIEQAMMAAIPLLEKRRFSDIEKLMRDASNVGLLKDDDEYDYWNEITNRTTVRHAFRTGSYTRSGITSGYAEIDANLYHLGWGRKELSCIMGAAKAGKSMSLGDFSMSASMAGYNVLYDTLEVGRAIIADRLDASVSDTLMKELTKDPDRVEKLIRAAKAKAARIELREHASGTLTPNSLNRMIERYKDDGVIFDLVTVDYADIMAANYRSDNQIDNLRSIYIDLRAIAFEHNVALLTATQTNREGAKAATAKATDIGDDWNKARTVDLLIGISATDAEKASNEARLTWLLSRNTEDGFALRIRQNRSKMKFIEKVLGRV